MDCHPFIHTWCASNKSQTYWYHYHYWYTHFHFMHTLLLVSNVNCFCWCTRALYAENLSMCMQQLKTDDFEAKNMLTVGTNVFMAKWLRQNNAWPRKSHVRLTWPYDFAAIDNWLIVRYIYSSIIFASSHTTCLWFWTAQEQHTHTQWCSLLLGSSPLKRVLRTPAASSMPGLG